MTGPYSGQAFQFQIENFIEVLHFLKENSGASIKEISNHFGMGEPKTKAILEYLRISDLIEEENLELTPLGGGSLSVYNTDFIQPLIYSKLCRGWYNGGHFYFSRMVNNVLYDVAFSYNNIITSDEAKEQILNYKNEIEVSEKGISKLSRQALTGLSNFDTGFGKMGIVSEIENNKFAVSYYDPHELVCAYIIYDRLKEGQTAVPFKDVISGDYHLGRLFYLTEDDIFDIFARLRDRNIIGMEITGGLNQLTINPKISKEDILEEMIKVG